MDAHWATYPPPPEGGPSIAMRHEAVVERVVKASKEKAAARRVDGHLKEVTTTLLDGTKRVIQRSELLEALAVGKTSTQIAEEWGAKRANILTFMRSMGIRYRDYPQYKSKSEVP